MSKKLVSLSVVKWGLLGAIIFWNASARGDPVADSSQGLEIVSSSHPMTLTVCECPKIAQRLSWDGKAAMLEGKVSYSTVPGATIQSVDAAHSQTFVLSFPTVSRSTHDELYVEVDNHKVKIGHLKKNQAGRFRVDLDPGVNFVAHRVEGKLGGEIVISPLACTSVFR